MQIRFELLKERMLLELPLFLTERSVHGFKRSLITGLDFRETQVYRLIHSVSLGWLFGFFGHGVTSGQVSFLRACPDSREEVLS